MSDQGVLMTRHQAAREAGVTYNTILLSSERGACTL